MVYIYPENLKAAPTLWLWQLRDLTIGRALAVLGAVLLMRSASTWWRRWPPCTCF